MRVQCPSCQSKMKLTATIDKVRCPKCDHLFKAAENEVQSSETKSRQPSQKKKQAAADPFGFDDEEDDDLFGSPSPSPRKRSSSNSSKRSKSRKQRSRRPKANAIPNEQVQKFGFTMMALGVGAFVLPLVGLQIKGLHAMPPEMQSMGGVCFFILGLVVLVFPYLRNLSPAVDNGFQLVKWGAIGLFALLIGGPILLLVGRLLFSVVAGGGGQAQDGGQVAQQMHEEAQERHRQAVQKIQEEAQERHRQAVQRMNEESDNFMNSNRKNSSSQSSTATQNNETPTAAAEEPVSPFQEVTSEAESPFQVVSEPDSTTESSKTPSSSATPSPFMPIPQPTTNQASSSSPSQQTVAVILKGFSRGETIRHMRDLRTAAESFRMRVVDMDDGASRIEFDAVKDTQTFADRISFGKVTNVDTAKNEITLEK